MSETAYNTSMPTLVTSQAYTSRVIHAIQHARKRVFVLALIIHQDKDASAILTALTRAAHRGVDVRILADFSTYSHKGGHFRPTTIYTRQNQMITDMVNRTRTSGAEFRWLGVSHPFIFAGRTHSKWIIADDTVFALGGINLHLNFVSDSDYMFEIKDPALADVLAAEHRSIVSADKNDTAYPSMAVDSAYGTVLIDGGIPFDSIIYRSAVAVARTAKEILVVTQYCPTGALAKAISSTNHRVYFNSARSRDPFTNWLIVTGQHITGIINSYDRLPYIHAKFLIATDENGVKTAITGSHNFISYGGILGTRELALKTQDKSIIAALEQYYRKNIA